MCLRFIQDYDKDENWNILKALLKSHIKLGTCDSYQKLWSFVARPTKIFEGISKLQRTVSGKNMRSVSLKHMKSME